MNLKLSPIRRQPSQKKKLLKQKQNNWVLDCINERKSKLQPYSSLKDKYLKYFIIGVPKKKKTYNRSPLKNKDVIVQSNNFQNYLNQQKQKVLQSKLELSQDGSVCKTGRNNQFDKQNQQNCRLSQTQGCQRNSTQGNLVSNRAYSQRKQNTYREQMQQGGNNENGKDSLMSQNNQQPNTDYQDNRDFQQQNKHGAEPIKIKINQIESEKDSQQQN